jgi:hypothetical protein
MTEDLPPTEVHFRKRHYFAEIAEVIGVDTDLILAARLHQNRFFVIFSYEDRGDDTVLCSARLKRNAEGVLVLDSVPVEHPNLWKQLLHTLEEEG